MKKFLLLIIAVSLFLQACGRLGKEAPLVILRDDIALPSLTALAWFTANDSPEELLFASAADDGLIRLWDPYSGRLMGAFHTGDSSNSEKGTILSLASGEYGPFKTALRLISYTETRYNSNLPLYSPDGTKKLLSAPDGSVCLIDIATEKELARYYGFRNGEWLSIVPDGFYNTSIEASPIEGALINGALIEGASLLVLKSADRQYRLDQLSGALFRPDLFRNSLMGGAAPFNVNELFKNENLPPLITLADDGPIKIKITEQNGGSGKFALYRRESGYTIPLGLFDLESAATQYTEKGRTCFEIILDPFLLNMGHEGSLPDAAFGVSAFNKSRTVESERFWIEEAGLQAFPAAKTERESIPAPVLMLLTVVMDDELIDKNLIDDTLIEETLIDETMIDKTLIEEFFSFQKKGALYSGLELVRLDGKDFSQTGLVKAAGESISRIGENDVLVLYIQGQGSADGFGNLIVKAENSAENSIDGILEEEILQTVFNFSGNSLVLLDLFPVVSADAIETALLRFRQRLGPKAVLAASRPQEKGTPLLNLVMKALAPDSMPPDFSAKSYTNTSELLTFVSHENPGLLYFSPLEDFRIAHNYMSNALPANQASVSFSRQGNLASFAFSEAMLRSSGIYISELNPANYQRINREAMEGMGMAPYYVAYLAGEKFYREGDYDRAIAEYGRAISQKADYADAYISRGNALRRKGDLERAIEDYSRALGLQNSSADVYNYRGYVYAQRGDFNRAIADYSQAIRYKSDYTDAYFNRAYAYAKLNTWDLCIADYTQVIRLEPSNAVAYNERGNAWLSKGDKPRANADFQAAERLAKN